MFQDKSNTYTVTTRKYFSLHTLYVTFVKSRHTDRSLSPQQEGQTDLLSLAALPPIPPFPPHTHYTVTYSDEQSCPEGRLCGMTSRRVPFLSHASGSKLSSCLEFSATQRCTAHQTLRKYSGCFGLWTSPSRLHGITHWTAAEKNSGCQLVTQWLHCSVISPVSKSSECVAESDAGCANDCTQKEIMNHLETASTTTWEIVLCNTRVSLLVNAAPLSKSCVYLFLKKKSFMMSILWNEFTPFIKNALHLPSVARWFNEHVVGQTSVTCILIKGAVCVF